MELKLVRRWIALAVVPVVLAGCASEDSEERSMADLPAADADELWSFLQQEDYRADWSLWPGMGELYEGTEPHGMLLTTYLNDAALDALNSAAGAMPVGAIIVKENYTPDGELAAITTMYRVDGYDPDHNDWFWAKHFPDGRIDVAGRPDGCISCHSAVADNDYVYTGSLSR